MDQETKQFFKLFEEYIKSISYDSLDVAKRDRDEYLKTNKQFCYSETFKKRYLALQFSYHFTQFLEERGFKTVEEKGYDFIDGGWEYSQPTYQNFNTSVDTSIQVPWRTTLFMQGPKFKMVINYSFNGDHSDNTYKVFVEEQYKEDLIQFFKDYEYYLKHNNIYKKKKLTYLGQSFIFLPHNNRKLESVVLSENIMIEINENVLNIFKKNSLYKKNNIPLKRGVVLSGPPGCGKTSVIDAICTELQGEVTIVFVTSQSTSYVSDISTIYEFARDVAPSIIIFEDIDLLGGDRSAGEFSPYIGELLNQLDGTVSNENVVTIATTNHIKRLDAALSNRPSRFDRNIKFDLPDLELRQQIFKQYVNQHLIDDSIRNGMRSIAYDLRDMSGAQIQEVVISAVLYALSKSDNNERIRLNREYIDFGIQKVKHMFNEFKGPLGFVQAKDKELNTCLNKKQENPPVQ